MPELRTAHTADIDASTRYAPVLRGGYWPASYLTARALGGDPTPWRRWIGADVSKNA